MSPDLLDRLAVLIGRLADFLKWVVAGALVRRATQLEDKTGHLERVHEIDEKQKEIAARPPSSLRALLERMRRREL